MFVLGLGSLNDCVRCYSPSYNLIFLFSKGCLSLPWALSQMGIVGGVVSIFVMSLWTSYNCWIVVRLKRYMERNSPSIPHDIANQDESLTATKSNETNSSIGISSEQMGQDGAASETGSRASTNITYPEVGEWAYGAQFEKYVSLCICTQQLAICTVFVSFVGENLLAVFTRLDLYMSHTAVLTISLPLLVALSLIPSLKQMAPVMALGFILLLASLGALGVIVLQEWSSRPSPDELPTVRPPQIPLALCAILYSYEGINLILPVESAMEQPERFAPVFVGSMVTVATLLAVVAVACVYAFGNVTSGSITAFLLQAYKDDDSVTTWLMVANTAVSLSVLLTYPLQLFPALELIGPMLEGSQFWTRFLCLNPNSNGDDDMEADLSAFEPLPPLPEHDVMDNEDMACNMEHDYYHSMDDVAKDRDNSKKDNNFTNLSNQESTTDAASVSAVSSISGIRFPRILNSNMPSDSVQMRIFLVIITYLVAVVVPNVQSLISLAGALAGSSTALLIPPALELAWVQHLEHLSSNTGMSTPGSRPPASPYQMRIIQYPQHRAGSEYNFNPISTQIKTWFQKWMNSKYWATELKCYVLLILGMIFMLIGTFAASADIIHIYVGTITA